MMRPMNLQYLLLLIIMLMMVIMTKWEGHTEGNTQASNKVLKVKIDDENADACDEIVILGKPPQNCLQVQMGIAQIAIAPPFRQPGTLGHFIFGPNWATLSKYRVDG